MTETDFFYRWLDAEAANGSIGFSDETYPCEALRESMLIAAFTKCAWKDTGDCWESSCGLHFTINDGTPADNGMIYCPRCGKGIQSMMPHDDSTIVVDATDEAREYLVLIMNATFDDKTFGAYIRTQLAGDFAFQLAKMLRKGARHDRSR